MIKIKLPTDCQNYSNIIDSCCNGILRDRELKTKIIVNKGGLLRISKYYLKLAKNNCLFKYKYHICHSDEIIRMGRFDSDLLTCTDMKKLYEDYFVRKRCGSYYDKIINYAKDPLIQCPFCGGIGVPSELDHFLPKVHFAYYSIFPYNLVPICKDCNKSCKNEFYPTEINKQLIHPYLDDDCFFEEQWLFANYCIENNIASGTVNYYVSPPTNWSEDKKGKVKFHFEQFKLDERFSIRAAPYLVDLIAQITRAKSKSKLSEADCIEIILDPIINESEYNKNHWKVALYQAVKNKFTHIWTNI
ncbi:hypothetical protein M8868_08380 [Pasteurella multocida]|nr:hypothetical protein [Pasteurella multocida]APW55537.1 hypothetical protein PMCN07_0953 [Pasteurella multocida subsp. multocida str. HN07]MBE7393468.1 hypothetical protein [Pasteurella multocida]MCL7755190.1 hypothetical protein [Pasteurella multocida]MCL7761087.1 hypothetical protein [Pasteurella multocida]MCL7771847.1 hypothetical protein [Pasteurella multocida]